MYRLHEFASSGNCYKLRLCMAHLDIPFERIQIDITKGETRTEEFLSINSNGKIPVLETPEGEYLPESNAALWYLAAGTHLQPLSKLDQARVLQWLFFEQYSHEPFIATSRFWLSILKAEEQYREQLDEKKPLGYAALDVMERHLEATDFLVGGQYSIADIALYAYTHLAPEGGFSLDGYTAIQAWLNRIEVTDKYISIHE